MHVMTGFGYLVLELCLSCGPRLSYGVGAPLVEVSKTQENVKRAGPPTGPCIRQRGVLGNQEQGLKAQLVNINL
jgi:hypothetical protein